MTKELKCDCGTTVYLSGFTNTCRCGRDYNSFGQLLAPRSQWGEETGESWQEILEVDRERNNRPPDQPVGIYLVDEKQIKNILKNKRGIRK